MNEKLIFWTILPIGLEFLDWSSGADLNAQIA